jgi:hypothetical protein
VQSPIAAGLGVSLLPRSRSARRGATTSRCGAWPASRRGRSRSSCRRPTPPARRHGHAGGPAGRRRRARRGAGGGRAPGLGIGAAAGAACRPVTGANTPASRLISGASGPPSRGRLRQGAPSRASLRTPGADGGAPPALTTRGCARRLIAGTPATRKSWREAARTTRPASRAGSERYRYGDSKRVTGPRCRAISGRSAGRTPEGRSARIRWNPAGSEGDWRADWRAPIYPGAATISRRNGPATRWSRARPGRVVDAGAHPAHPDPAAPKRSAATRERHRCGGTSGSRGGRATSPRSVGGPGATSLESAGAHRPHQLRLRPARAGRRAYRRLA